MYKSEQIKSYYIYFAALSTTLIAFGLASCYTWSSPVIIKFESSDPTINPIGASVTILESTWIVSAMGVGLMTGPPLSILCSRYLLKKTTLLLVSTFIALGHIICIFACEVWHFIGARFLMGLGCGAVLNILATYLAEISEDSNRGVLGSFTGVLSNIGSLFIYIIGPYLQISVFSVINLVPLLLFYILFGFCVPHSPYDLVKRKKNNQAKNSLMKLRKSSNVDKELAFIIESVESSCSSNFKITDLFYNKGLFKALLLSMGLMACQQLSGILAVGAYTQTIFELAGGAISSAVSAMIIGLVSLISSITSCQLSDRMGRKFLLATSCISDCISLFLLGVYFYLLDNGKDVSMLSWLPIVSLIVFMVGFNFGLIIQPWVVMAELFPSNAKPAAATISSLTNFTLSFSVSFCFPYMATYLGMALTFWIFSGLMVIGSVFCLVCVPETKGKSFQEIIKMLEG